MAVCQVCGCKTDELDFVDGRIGNLEKRVCSFCNRQLKNIDNENISDAQLKWLNAVVCKEVPEREQDVSDALNEIIRKHAPQVVTPVYQQTPPAQVKLYNTANNGQRVTPEDKDEIIAQLSSRVDKLEKTIAMMRRSQLIKLICEISLPIILGIIILIIFFSSDFYRQISYILKSFM